LHQNAEAEGGADGEAGQQVGAGEVALAGEGDEEVDEGCEGEAVAVEGGAGGEVVGWID
jgi:hypothetical protein